MESNDGYNIVISSGNTDDDHLQAEIYLGNDIYLATVYFDGSKVMIEFTCEADNEICNGRREISLTKFAEAVNEACLLLEINFKLIPDQMQE